MRVSAERNPARWVPIVALRNVVGEAEDVLVEAVVPLQRDFDTDPILFTLDIEVEDLVDRRLVGVQVGDERAEATFVLEQLFLGRTLITQQDADPELRKDSSRSRLARMSQLK